VSRELERAIARFTSFLEWGITPPKRKRYRALVTTARGRKKILAGLYHELESDLDQRHRQSTVPETLLNAMCRTFHGSTFGDACVPYETALRTSSESSSWLILSEDGNFAYHHPEDFFDGDTFLMNPKS